MKSIIKNEFENIDNLLKQITIKDYPFDNEKTLSLLENSENLSEVDAINNTENISKLPEKIIPSHFAQNSNWIGNVMISIMQYKVIIMNLFILTSLLGLVSLFYNSASDENTILTNKADTTQTTITISGFSVSDTLNNVILTDTNSKSQQSGLVILSRQVEEEQKDSVMHHTDFKSTNNEGTDSLMYIVDGNNQIMVRKNKNQNYFLKPSVKQYFTNTSLKYLELSKLELNNIVPKSFVNDTLLNIYKDVLIETKSQFESYKVKELGYKIEDLPLFISEKYIVKNADTAIIMYGWLQEKSTHQIIPNFDKAKFVSFSLLDSNNQMYMWGEGTLLHAKYSVKSKLNKFYDLFKSRLFPIIPMDSVTITIYTDEVKKNEREFQELENLFYEDVIPVKVPLFDGKSVMFFFKPTEEFIAKLPERYRESIKNEVAAKRLLEQNQPFSCETKNFTTDIFALCNDTETIQNARLFPNPGGSELNLSLKVLQDRKTKIELCDFSGNLLKELMSIDFVVGEKVVNIDIDKIPMGLYFIRLSTDKGEVINLRYIKDK